MVAGFVGLVVLLVATPAVGFGGVCSPGHLRARLQCGAAVLHALASCASEAREDARECRLGCRDLTPRRALAACRRGCRAERREAVASCSIEVARAEPGPAELPVLPGGRPGDLSLLSAEERAVVAEADARAPALRARSLQVHLGRPGVELRVAQVKHGFPFGFPIDVNRFQSDEDLAFYERIMGDHFRLAVLENSAKWARVEPEPGVRFYDRVDADVAWAEANGFDVKGHTLLWGIIPPFSTSGLPPWAIQRYGIAPTSLGPAEQDELRQILRAHVFDLVGRYRESVSVWDVTNETLQPLAQWFVRALGPEVVNDMFRWAREADPDATLVFNEWIVEVFTGLFPHPTAADVRDRVLELLAAGVPIDALGQQAHFAPTLAFAGVPVDLSGRTPVDVYAEALDTLAETGLPIHITELNFIQPDDPELRAAHAEALMRLWWGHPSVEQIVFWGPWNKVAGRDEFDVGLWDDDGNVSRHGEAVLSLLNERWRTDVTATTGRWGATRLDATHGDYVAEWRQRGRTLHARFRVEPGAGTAHVVLTGR